MKNTNRIKKENLIIDLEANNKEEVINQISKVLFENGFVSNFDDFMDAVIDRENQISTGIGHGIAIPHGKSTTVNESTVAVAKLKNPINWDSLDDEPVSLVFLLAIEEEAESNDHLKILADVSVKLMDDDFIRRTEEANNIEEMYEVLGEI